MTRDGDAFDGDAFDPEAFDQDVEDRPDVLHRVLDGLRRMPDQREDPDREDRDAVSTPREDGAGTDALPRRRH